MSKNKRAENITKNDGRRCRIVSYVSQEELAHIDDYAAKANMTRSDFIRHCATFTPLPDPQKYHYIDALLKQLADLARLGNLLKMTLDDDAVVRNLMKGKDEISAAIDQIIYLKDEEIRPILNKINGTSPKNTKFKRKKYAYLTQKSEEEQP